MKMNTEQKATSAKTSLKQVPALFKSAPFEAAAKNAATKTRAVLNYGAGQYPELTADFVQGRYNIDVHAYDKYNLSDEMNADTLSFADYPIVCVANVLNVIDSDFAAELAINNAVSHMAYDGVTLVTVYEGNGTGIGTYTMNGESYQRNVKTADFVRLIQEWLEYRWSVTRRGKVIVIRNRHLFGDTERE